MRMRGWTIFMCALLTAGAAQSVEAEESYAKAGNWEISAEPPSQRCVMQRFYRSEAAKKKEGLVVLYAADKEGVMLGWTNDWMTYLPAQGELELGLAFKKGAAVDDSWGFRKLRYKKLAGTYHFTLAFTNSDEARRFLGALAGNDSFGLFLGPALLTSLPLDAADAVGMLRECSSKGGAH